jgi:hypothetical protein
MSHVAEVRSEIRAVREAVEAETQRLNFLRVRVEFCGFVDSTALFGDAVEQAFPSASRDIKEVGNCLAAECGTAAVFHAMRAAEVALRVLAADRCVYPGGSIGLKQWGELLSALDGKLAEMEKADTSLWPARNVKATQIRFYRSAQAEFRDFNEAWRKHLAHGHDGAFYDSLKAQSIVNHVKSFMLSLAEKLTEGAPTPLYWTTI